MFTKTENWQNGLLCKKERNCILCRSLLLHVIYQAGSATKSGRLLIIVVDVGYDDGWGRGEYRILLNRAAKSSAARASARAHRGIPRALFRPREDRQGHAHPDIDSLTASVFARRYHRVRRIRSRIYGEIRILVGTIVRETLRDYPQTTPSDCFIFIVHQKLLRNFSRIAGQFWKLRTASNNITRARNY